MAEEFVPINAALNDVKTVVERERDKLNGGTGGSTIPTLPKGESRKGENIILPSIIGVPPSYSGGMIENGAPADMSEVIADTMPILEIFPSEQTAVAGLELYRLTPAFAQFAEELNEKYKITIPSNEDQSIKVACLNNSPPMESFSNDFTESNLASGMMPEANDVLSTASFVLGATSANVGERIGAVEKANGPLGGILSKAGGAASDIQKKLQEEASKGGLKGAAARSALMAAAMKAGRGIDFPQVWKTSSWSPSYSINVRLYNPSPGSVALTNKYIVAPLATLLMFVVPRTNDGYTFFWPWMCHYRMRGLFDIKGGYIKSIQVVKGGDDNAIAFNQRPGIVDLKIELGTVFSTMISNRNQSLSDIPSLTDWLDNFEDSKPWVKNNSIGGPSWTAKETDNEQGSANNVSNISTQSTVDLDKKISSREGKSAQKKPGPTGGNEKSRTQQVRVPEEAKDLQDKLDQR